MDFEWDDICDEESIDIVIDWIKQHPEFFDDLEKNNPQKRSRDGRAKKYDYWESRWGQMILNPSVRDPTSKLGKLFRRRFR